MGVFQLIFNLFLFLFIRKTYGNPSCPKLKPGMTNVHIVCHTHDDVGWLKTVDQYYYGANKYVTWVGVQYILDSVVESLQKDPQRKFIYVESAFFFRWWDEQSDKTKSIVKRLVESGQLEFIGGGWCMNDEAAPHYTAIIDQMTLGLAKLNETFGDVAFPRIAWQIDPFGHSKEQASLFAQMGMDGLFFGRLDHDDKNHRWNTKTMEMVWKGSNSLGKSAWLFTGVLPNNYSPPKGFCFDLLCGDEPIMDDPNLEDYNKNEMVANFIKAVEDQKTGYATSNLIMTMGEDFNYVYAESWYKNLDKLMKYVNGLQSNGSKVNLVYSTPSCYLDALYREKKTWPTKSDDFFPYSSDPHAYWTGYFTSRPTLKGFIRYSNNLLQAVKQISALAGTGKSEGVERLAKAMAVAQHHDAVTGTAKQHVTDDYSKRLSDGVEHAYNDLNMVIRSRTQSPNALPGVPTFEHCTNLNISECSFTEKNAKFTVFVYNSLSRVQSRYIRIPVTNSANYEVLDEQNNQLVTQLLVIPKSVKNMPGRKSSARYNLVFYAENLPALGIKQFLVQMRSSRSRSRDLKNRYRLSGNDLVISKGDMTLVFDGKSEHLKEIQYKHSDNDIRKNKLSQDWVWYEGKNGDNRNFAARASGAYIFRPDGDSKHFNGSSKITAHYDGPLVSEIHQEWTSWVSQVIRIYKHMNFVDIEWVVGPIPVNDDIGKEIVSRVTWPQMSTNATFYTDSNGREMQKRVKDYRPTWKLQSTEPVSQNYYPVVSTLAIQSTNGKGSAGILNDRAQGGSSMYDGEMELMAHRRLLHDDAFGVGEPLNETAYGEGLVALGHHYLIHSDFGSKSCDFGCQHRSLAEEVFWEPILSFSSFSAFTPKSTQETLSKTLPNNIRILTLEPWKDSSWLLRLENFYEVNESSRSGKSSVNIQNLFTEWSITDIKEVTLGANRFKKDSHRLQWNTEDDLGTSYDKQEEDSIKNYQEIKSGVYELEPMQIRTFILKVSSK